MIDTSYNFARQNGFIYKHHTFIWGQSEPGWLSGLSSTQKLQQIEKWMQIYCQRYPLTDLIDVVNEPLHAPPSFASALGGNGTTGWDWVIWCF
jgi:endo-1,4-beta-xylanase